MSDLLSQAIEAHGGLGRWRSLSSATLDLSIAGALWSAKMVSGALERTTATLDTRRQRLVFSPFGGADRLSVFEPWRVALETLDGRLIESRYSPRAAFKDHLQVTPWDLLHAAYFSSYALWGYLTAPFLYASPGFVAQEIEPWVENGETWRRLRIIFPDSLATHSREQVSYFGPDGLLRRHDYSVEVLGGARGANYASNYRTFDGLVIPTVRRVYAHGDDGRPIPEPLLVSIDIDHMAFS